MAPKPCPRCGLAVMPSDGERGRPRKWCSDRCRRLASEERRAATTGKRPIEIREEIREKLVERSRPLSPDGAVEKVLSSDAATERLLRVLAHRRRRNPPQTATEKWADSRMHPLFYDLWQAYHDGGETPIPMPATAAGNPAPAGPPGQREAVDVVLGSPRSVREVLTALTEQARAGTLARGEHSGTVRAAHELLVALHQQALLR